MQELLAPVFDQNRGFLISRPAIMYKFVLLLVILISLLSSCRKDPSNDVNDTIVSTICSYPFKYSSQNNFKHISAHRGGGDINGFPENCLESMMYIDQKTDAWQEIDIRKTKDGKLILMHDASLDRTTNGTGKVADKTFDELKHLRLKDNFGNLTDFHIPLLRDVLIWNENKGRTVLNLDIKQDVSYKEVLRLVESTKQLDNTVAIVYSLDQAKAMRRLNKDIVISLPVRNEAEWQRLNGSDLGLSNLIAFTGTIRSSPELYDTLHEHNILAIFGTMGNIDRQAAKQGSKVYQQLYADGADVLSTDRPLDF